MISETKYDFSDVLIQPTFSDIESRSSVKLEVEYKFKYSPLTLKCIPVMAANMDTVGTIPVMKELVKHNLFTCLHKFVSLEELSKERDFLSQHLDNFAISIGFSDNELKRLIEISKHIDFKVICIDVANGYIGKFSGYCCTIRNLFPDKIIIAGNVCTKEGVELLDTYGKVDIVKCGIGGGSACTTRIKTGVGLPQFSCALECSVYGRENDLKIISDGGITCPGDVSKAFGAGADFVMIGGQFAGHSESPGKIIEENGKMYKEFWGMSSEHAMNKNYGEMKSYRTSEGRHMKIPYKGNIQGTIEDYLGGIRSTCTYTGYEYLEHMIGNIHFIKVNNQYNSSLIR